MIVVGGNCPETGGNVLLETGWGNCPGGICPGKVSEEMSGRKLSVSPTEVASYSCSAIAC